MIPVSASVHQPGSGLSHSLRRLSVAAIYDGPLAVALIEAAKEQLLRLLGADISVKFYAWSFYKLELPDIRAMALHIAEDSGVILIASTGTESVPEHVQRWLNSCFAAQESRRALVMALEPEGSLCSFAQQLASRWQTQHVCAVDLDQAQSREMVLQAVSRHLEMRVAEEKAGGQWLEAENCLPPPKPNRPPPVMPGIVNQPELCEKIRMSAYELWLAAGRPPGRELEFWLQAERDFLDRKADENRSAD